MTDGRRAVVGRHVVTPDGALEDGHVVLDGDRVVAVAAGAPPADVPVLAEGAWVAPGFVDVQINGAHGVDITTQPERLDELAAALPRYGVTAFLPTVVTCPSEQRVAALDALAERPAETAGAQPLGAHVEGPMLAPIRRGAHPEAHLALPDPQLITGWSARSGIALVTLAPELPGALDVIAALVERGVVVSIGHTDCSAAQFADAVAAGATYVTHLFNAMRPFGHRDPGPVGAALADGTVIAGLICDGIHVDPVTVRMAWRALGPDHFNLVTDAISALGDERRDGSRLGSVRITIDGGAVRTAGGVLAGSVLSLDEAVRNLVEFAGCSVPEAIGTVTATPARLLGLADRGRLVPGARADLVVLDAQLGVVTTVVGGATAWRS